MTPEYEPCIYHSVEVPVYFEIHVATTANENVQCGGKGLLQVQTCVFISSVFAAGDRVSYKDAKLGKGKRRKD